MKFKILIKFIVLTHILVNAIVGISEAALAVNPANIAITTPLNHIFLGPANAIQRFARIASDPTSLRDAVRTAFDNRIPNVAGLPAVGNINITQVNTVINNAIKALSKQMVKQLAEILSPIEVTATQALRTLDPTITAPEAQLAFNAFKAIREAPEQALVTGTEGIADLPVPTAAGAPNPNFIVVPSPTLPGLQNCITPLGVTPSLEELIAVIQNVYYNQIRLNAFTKHVRNIHIGAQAISGDIDKTRFYAANVHAAMHYIRFVLNLILPENVLLNVIQKYPENRDSRQAPTLEDNIVYIECKVVYHNQIATRKRDIIIHYQFPYAIGEGRLRPIVMKKLNIILANHTPGNSHTVAWHFKSAYPVTG